VNFSVFEGEVFGIAGVSGNGQQELCEAICGSLAISRGTIRLGGEDISSLPVYDRIERGIGYVVSDRHKEGLVMEMSIAENMILKSSFGGRWTWHGFLNKKKIRACAEGAIADYRIKAPGPDVPAKSLSGGNQQRVVLAREVDRGEKIIIFDQPTRGLDLGAIDHIHKIILSQREKGKSILLVSTELSEIFTLADRIAVIYKGKIQGVYQRSELTAEKVGLLMAGYAMDKAAS
jgi:simple sugar transport system ATP-binding protein